MSADEEKKLTGVLLLLAKSEEFKMYQVVLRKQVEARKNKIISTPITDSNSIALHNMLVGEISGLETAISLPGKSLAGAEDEKLIDEYRKQLEGEEKENGN